MREPAELLIEPRWLLPMSAGGAVLEGHAVVIDAGRILAVGPVAELSARYVPREHLRREQHALLPGLINAHTRASLSLLRACLPYGGARRVPETSLMRAAGADFVRDGTRLAMAEMLRAGITCFADLSPHPEESARAAAAAQMRACIALPVADENEGATAQLARAERLWDEYRSDARISLYFAPLGSAVLSDATLGRVRRVADELEARVALCVASDSEGEAYGVRDAALPRAAHGTALLGRLADLGLLRPGFAAIGALDEAQAECIERHGAALIACPQASLRTGFTGMPLLQGERTGIGSGSPAAVGAVDMFAEARTAALLGGFGAAQALRLITSGSATALGLASQVGSIECGKAADLTCIVVDALTRASSASLEDAIVFGSTRAAVSDVWTSGRAAVRAHTLLAFDDRELERIPAHWTQRLKLGVAA